MLQLYFEVMSVLRKLNKNRWIQNSYLFIKCMYYIKQNNYNVYQINKIKM